MVFVKIWLLIGFITYLIFFIKKHKFWHHRVRCGNLSYQALAVGFVLTVLFFPVAIYTNWNRG